jgi:hypothetical protein
MSSQGPSGSGTGLFAANSQGCGQPSSADVERFFSRLKTTDLMMLEHDETLETRAFCILVYNK